MTSASGLAAGATLLLATVLLQTEAPAAQASPPTDHETGVTQVGSCVVIDGLPPPVGPAVMTRDTDGGVTIRAIRLTEGLSLDGRLDEGICGEVRPVGRFIQTLPDAGQPATEETAVWVMFDAENVYVAARCWQRDMVQTLVANTMRGDRARQDDGLAVALIPSTTARTD